jgi:hypothetical protein
LQIDHSPVVRQNSRWRSSFAQCREPEGMVDEIGGLTRHNAHRVDEHIGPFQLNR